MKWMLSCRKSLIFTSHSPSYKQTCVKILKFTFNFKSLVRYMFRPIWSSSGVSKIALETCCTPVNEYSSKIQPRLYAHVLLYVCNLYANCVSTSCMDYIGVPHNVVGCMLTCSAWANTLMCRVQLL